MVIEKYGTIKLELDADTAPITVANFVKLVTEGIEIVDKICKNTPVIDNNGTVKSENQPKIKRVRVVD